MVDYMQNGVGGGHGIWMLLFWVLLVVIVVASLRLLRGRSGDRRSRAAESAMEILKKRFASGEIGKDEFEQKKRDLES